MNQTVAALARGGGAVYGVLGYDDSQYGGSHHRSGSRCRAAQYEGGAHQLYAEPGGLHSDQRLGRGSVWDAARFLKRDCHIYGWVAALWSFDERANPSRRSHPSGMWRGDDDARGTHYHRSDVSQVG